MVTEKEKVIDELKTIELKLMNHSDAQVRYKWGVTSDGILGERSVWNDIEDQDELHKALNSAKSLLKGRPQEEAPQAEVAQEEAPQAEVPQEEVPQAEVAH